MFSTVNSFLALLELLPDLFIGCKIIQADMKVKNELGETVDARGIIYDMGLQQRFCTHGFRTRTASESPVRL